MTNKLIEQMVPCAYKVTYSNNVGQTMFFGAAIAQQKDKE